MEEEVNKRSCLSLVFKANSARLERGKQGIDREYLLRMSYMEIYNERINDLLNSQRPPASLKIRTANGQVKVTLSLQLTHSLFCVA